MWWNSFNKTKSTFKTVDFNRSKFDPKKAKKNRETTFDASRSRSITPKSKKSFFKKMKKSNKKVKTDQFLLDNMFNKPIQYNAMIKEFTKTSNFDYVCEFLTTNGKKLGKYKVEEQLRFNFTINKPEVFVKIWRIDMEKKDISLIGKKQKIFQKHFSLSFV